MGSEGDRCASDVDRQGLLGQLRVPGALAEELDQISVGETTLATPTHATGRQQAGVAPAANRRLAHPEEAGSFFSI
jgi:hypothetical protein